MGWLDERDITCRYVCADNHESRYTYKMSEVPEEERRKAIACPVEGCQHDAPYVGFVSDEVNVQSRVTYDQNGRKAIKVDDGRGNITYMSATKEKYLRTGIIDHQYTDAYKDKLERDKEANEHFLKSDFNRRMAQVTAYTGKPKSGRKAATP